MRRALASSASTCRVATSTTLKRRGARGAGSGFDFGRRVFGATSGSFFACGCLSTDSRGTICAPVPLVSVSRTQTLPFICL